MFNFRLVTMADGNQIIDITLKTPYEALTPLQMMEYMEVDNSLSYMERMEKRKRIEEAKRNTVGHKFKLLLSVVLA